jgi:hypothetical protein
MNPFVERTRRLTCREIAGLGPAAPQARAWLSAPRWRTLKNSVRCCEFQVKTNMRLADPAGARGRNR